jgi:hypothetical protein
MDFAYHQFIPEDFHPSSRVWVYQSNRLFTIAEAFKIEDLLNGFVAEWKTHGEPVKGYANLLFGQFLVFMADITTGGGVSGCSTDSSVRVLKEIEKMYKVDLFNRQNLAFVVKDKIEVLPMAQLNYALENNFIRADTLYFNNLVNTKEEWLNQWLMPAKESWLSTKIPALQTA